MIRFFNAVCIGLGIMSSSYSATLDLQHYKQEGDVFCKTLAEKIRPSNLLALDANHVISQIRHLVMSDRVAFFFNVTAESQDNSLYLHGEVERPEFIDILEGTLKCLGYPPVKSQISVVPNLKQNANPYGIVTERQILTYSKASLEGIPMDEALFGEPVYILHELPSAYLIKTFNGYWGYAPRKGIRRVSRERFIHYLNGETVCVQSNQWVDNIPIPAGTRLRLHSVNGTLYRINGPSGNEFEINHNCCQRSDRNTRIPTVVAFARSMLNSPYNLGGKNSETGIDCSGLIQMSYRTIGINLARDAKQQYLSGNYIAPSLNDALLPGDALFFMGPSGQVDHVAMYIGNREIIHATMPKVAIQSMDPQSANYCKRFDSDYIGAKRFCW